MEALRELHAEEMEAATNENVALKAALAEHLEPAEIQALVPPSGDRLLTAASVADVEQQVASVLLLGLKAELASVKAQADKLALVAAAGTFQRAVTEKLFPCETPPGPVAPTSLSTSPWQARRHRRSWRRSKRTATRRLCAARWTPCAVSWRRRGRHATSCK
jgi:hypothetical protein